MFDTLRLEGPRKGREQQTVTAVHFLEACLKIERELEGK